MFSYVIALRPVSLRLSNEQMLVSSVRPSHMPDLHFRRVSNDKVSISKTGIARELITVCHGYLRRIELAIGYPRRNLQSN